MSNIRWTGIEKYKYNLTANWYVSAQYGNDYDVDGVGLFHPVNNPNGHGGKLRPFATLDKIIQNSGLTYGTVVIFDTGKYTSINACLFSFKCVGDGVVTFYDWRNIIDYYNCNVVNCFYGQDNSSPICYDSKLLKCYRGDHNWFRVKLINSIAIDCVEMFYDCINSILINCLHNLALNSYNNILINTPTDWYSNTLVSDYCVMIGKFNTLYNPVNGKTANVTLEDYKADGKYFLKSFSEVDLFGNASGSGATTEQLQQIFNGYFSPIMPDDLPFLDMSLKPTASNKIKYGGLNGYYIGALPVGYSFSAADLWNTWRDVGSTTGMKYDDGICLDTNQTSGTYRSIRISLPKPVIVDAVNFFNNLLYNESNVAAQRIDITPDAMPDNTQNQRTVYDYRLSYSPSVGGALSEFKNFELNKPPYIDSNGNSALADAYADGDRNLITVQDFIIEFKIVVV